MSISLETLGIIAAVIGYASSGLIGLRYLQRKRLEREKKDLEFVSKLTVALANGAVSNLGDISDLYIGFFLLREFDGPDPRRLATLLRRVKLDISTSNPTPSKSLDLVNQLLVAVNQQEKEAIAKAPFSGVPAPERSLLEDIREISGAKTNKFIQDKLSELADAIRIRQEMVEKLGEEKGTSLKWAKWGLFGTVFFSVVSIIITYYLS